MEEKNKEIREKLISREAMARRAFEMCCVPYEGKETFHLGKFLLSEAVIDLIENVGYCYEAAFNKSEHFIWHPSGEEWKVPDDKLFSISARLEFASFGVLIVPFIDGYETLMGSSELARILFLNNLEGRSYPKAIVEGIQQKNNVAALLLYSILIRGVISLKELFYGTFANGSEMVLNLADSSVSPFRGSLDPTQNDSGVLFVSPEIEKQVLGVWKSDFNSFFADMQFFKNTLK